MQPIIRDMTDFIFIEHTPESSDIIFIPGSGYGALAQTAAKLWHQGFAPLILPSGSHSILQNNFCGSEDGITPQGLDVFANECDFHKALLLEQGIPENAILTENQASYTYENAIYSKKLTDSLNLNISKAIICCQAFHARRCLLYYELLYPQTQFFICPTVTQNISCDNWFLDEIKIDRVLGEIERCGSQFHEILKNLLAKSTRT